jgi:hypothetical protein
MSELETYIVVADWIEGVRETFQCEAEDTEHAREQAENAYPGCDIVSVDRNTSDQA